MLRIVTFPHPALRHKSTPVRRIDDLVRAAVRQMFGLMYEAKGIGLAANQVALPLRFFVLNVTGDPEQPDQERVFINPEILKRESVVEEEEGCLSLPTLYGKVRRSKKIRFRAFDLQGRAIEEDVDGLLSRAIQHEHDHLDGTLITDRFDPPVRAANAAKLREIEQAFRKAQAGGLWPDDEAMQRRVVELAGLGVVPPEVLEGPPPPPEPDGLAAEGSEAPPQVPEL
ncbi:peptide deformylase [Tautonia plasticadhaerens]|uniref:Peptide deformylase n=1 Tax=Tautonia plasticadhaerens TaxID=2527974 RepID=A0A518H155_9BACT|nr:peptide deformylase [Tautonia plasticadhaerens]QDV34568.1 Peptide deformylase [Tautonia plasticadhaerens]